MKSKGIAYFLWLIGAFGLLGFHRFYLGKIGTGILWFFTGGLFGIGAFIDLFTLGSKVEDYNIKRELKVIRINAYMQSQRTKHDSLYQDFPIYSTDDLV